MNKLIDNALKFISRFTNKKIFVSQEIDIINTTPIKIIPKCVTPSYKLKNDVGSFELYGTTMGTLGSVKYRLLHKESKTNLVLSEKMFNLLFEKEK